MVFVVQRLQTTDSLICWSLQLAALRKVRMVDLLLCVCNTLDTSNDRCCGLYSASDSLVCIFGFSGAYLCVCKTLATSNQRSGAWVRFFYSIPNP